MRYSLILAAVVGASSAMYASRAEAQQAPVDSSEAASSLRRCVALADSGKTADAASLGRSVEALFRQRAARNPRDIEALVGVARAISQCRVPGAEFVEQGALTADALELLDRALELAPDHWMARFVAASIAFRSPAFLGRGPRAAKELDMLLRLQGDRTDNPVFARVYAMRGIQLSREGKIDSARVLWQRGAKLFPGDAELRSLVQKNASAPPAPPAASLDSPATPATLATLAAVRVTASTSPPRVALPSMREVSRAQVLAAPGGAADVLQAVQLQPGVTRVGEGADIYTRGGDVNETALVVNGARLLSLARFEGLSGSLFGAIEPFVVKSARFSSGGFTARHGNALSGVLEIETDGRPRERQARAGISLVQASGTLRAPITKTIGGWASGRVSHTAALLATHGRTDEFRGAPRSQEMIASLIASPTPFTELRVTGVMEHDDSERYMTAAGWQGTFDSRGDMRALALSTRWMSSTLPLVVRGSLAGSSHATDWAFGVLARERNERSASARVDVEYEAPWGASIRGGIEQGAQTRVDAGSVPTSSSVARGAPLRILEQTQANANQLGGYAETEFGFGRTTVVAGARADRLPGERDVTVDPRLALSLVAGAWTTRLSGGVFHQGRWRGDAAIPDAATPSGLPRTANHLVLGTEREGAHGMLRAEVFVKSYEDYGTFGAGPSIARALARGMDLIAQRTAGRTTGWVGYSLLDVKDHLADGRDVRGPFDVTHSATGSVTTALNNDWSLGTTLRYGSGAPRTPVLGGRATGDGRFEPIYGALMSERLPAYGRLDARLMRYVRTPSFLLTMFAEVLNVTSHANASTFTYDPAYTTRSSVPTFFSRRTVVVGGEFMFR
jgi:hypothetical protein